MYHQRNKTVRVQQCSFQTADMVDHLNNVLIDGLFILRVDAISHKGGKLCVNFYSIAVKDTSCNVRHLTIFELATRPSN